MQNLKECLDKFAGKKVLVLGDVFIDEYVYGDCTRISPEAPVPVFLVDPKKTRCTLGGAANTAANIVGLGGDAILIGRQGSDQAAEVLTELCRKQGINYTGVPHAGPTTRKTRVVAQRQQMLRIDKEVVEPSGKLTEEIVFALFKKALPFADIVVLSDYAKGFFTDRLCAMIIEATHLAEKIVVVDPKPLNWTFYTDCDYVTPNQKEWDACRVGTRNVLVTMGELGMRFVPECNKTPIIFVPAVTQEAFDVSGAGDTVVAAFSLSLAAGLDVETAMKISNLAAGIAVTKFGTYAVTKEDMLHE